jgi:hypothetical protein
MSAAPDVIYCPRCGRPTDCLRSVDIPVVIFVIFYIAWASERIVGCAPCLRAHVAQRTLLSIFLANVVFPVLLLFFAFEWTTTFRPGHGVEDEELGLYRSPPVARPSFQSKPNAARLLLVVGILVAVLLGIIAVAHFSGR